MTYLTYSHALHFCALVTTFFKMYKAVGNVHAPNNVQPGVSSEEFHFKLPFNLPLRDKS